MQYPLEKISPSMRGSMFRVLLPLTLGLMAALWATDEPLRTEESTANLFGLPVRGIVAFEVAGDEITARRIIESWGPGRRILAAFNLGLDYLYLVVYSTTIGLGCVWAKTMLTPRNLPMVRTGTLLAWGQWLAAALDATENVALMTMLLGTIASPWPQLARGCALPKFLLVVLGLLYVAYGGLARFNTRRQTSTPR